MISSKFIKQSTSYFKYYTTTNNNLDKLQLIEKAYDYILPPFQPVIIRLDGVSFGKLTKKFELKQHDERFHESMKQTSTTLFNHFIGCKLIYSFSDEINILLLNHFPKSQFLSNRIQKLTSIASSITSVNFSNNLSTLLRNNSSNNNNNNDSEVLAYFDCRSFVIPLNEVGNYFEKRQKRCYSNCLTSIAVENGIYNNSDNNNIFNNDKFEVSVRKDIIAREKLLEKQGLLSTCPEHFKKGFIVYKDGNSNNQYNFISSNFKDIDLIQTLLLPIKQ